jgi:hypothetical protein
LGSEKPELVAEDAQDFRKKETRGSPFDPEKHKFIFGE